MSIVDQQAAGLDASQMGRKATLLLVASLTIMAGTTISPALPAIEAEFSDVPNAALLSRMVLTLPSLLVALCAPLIGTLADRIGRRRLLIGSVVLYGVSGVSGLFVDSLHALLVGRAVLGAAIGGIMTLVTALVGDYFAGNERERYLGLQQAFTGLGGVAFVLGGGLLAELHWRMPFAVYALALLLVPAIVLFLSEPRHFAGEAPRPADIAAGEKPRRGAVAALCLLTFLINLCFYVVPSQLPFHLRDLAAGSPTSAGLALGLHNLMMAATALCYGLLRARMGGASIFGAGLALMAAGFGLVSMAQGITLVLVAMAVAGMGLGLVVPNLMSTAIAVAGPLARGRVAGAVTAAMFLGHFMSPVFSQPWIARFGYPATFRDVAALLLLLALAAVVVGRFERRRA